MLKNILSILLIAVLMSSTAFAKDLQKANFSATMEGAKSKNKIEKVLNKTNGVEKVNVDLKNQSVLVEYNNEVITEAQIAETINRVDAKFNAKTGTTGKKCDHKKDGHKCSHKEKKDHQGCNKPCKK